MFISGYIVTWFSYSLYQIKINQVSWISSQRYVIIYIHVFAVNGILEFLFWAIKSIHIYIPVPFVSGCGSKEYMQKHTHSLKRNEIFGQRSIGMFIWQKCNKHKDTRDHHQNSNLQMYYKLLQQCKQNISIVLFLHY